jgi:hypothetical protein
MRQFIKAFVYQLSPAMGNWISSYCFRRHCRNKFQGFQNEVAQRLYEGREIRVLSGPFAGMVYVNEVVWGPITPRWIGSYEEELHGVIGQVIAGKYKQVVDVGSAEGYYAVGLARSLQGTTIYSFDTDPFARKVQGKLARLNHVENLAIGTYCSHSTIQKLAVEDSFIICDIEGAEYDLIDPVKAGNLRNCDLLVEVHPFRGLSRDQVREELHGRFGKSHKAVLVRQQERDLDKYKEVTEGKLSELDLTRAMDEDRTGNESCWLWLQRV